jgi:hypothetical protein
LAGAVASSSSIAVDARLSAGGRPWTIGDVTGPGSLSLPGGGRRRPVVVSRGACPVGRRGGEGFARAHHDDHETFDGGRRLAFAFARACGRRRAPGRAAAQRPAARSSYCSDSSKAGARRPSAGGAQTAPFVAKQRSRPAVPLVVRTGRVARSARSRRERHRADRPATGRAGGALLRARSPSWAVRHADVSSTSACSARSVAGP